MATLTTEGEIDVEETLRMLDVKLKQLKLDYEQYFAGVRPREPQQARSEIQKAVVMFSQKPIKNTAHRFKFNTINSRYQSFKRQWDNVLRQIDSGTYKRHVFKADLHDRERTNRSQQALNREAAQPGGGAAAPAESLFDSYLSAAKSCGQNVSGLTPEKLQGVVKKQEAAIRAKLGCDKVNFRVVVESGKVKLKASAGS